MQYTVVQSKDPYLLATDLQMSGVKYRNNSFDAFHEVIDHIHIDADNTFSFQAHGWCPNTLPEDRHELTSRNYIKVLTQILEP